MEKTTLKIDGMMCGMCEAHVNNAIKSSAKVKKVTSSHSSGETVVISEEPLDMEIINKAVEEIGYKVLSVSVEPFEKKGLFSFLKK